MSRDTTPVELPRWVVSLALWQMLQRAEHYDDYFQENPDDQDCIDMDDAIKIMSKVAG
jgi:hypothetical protein